MNSFKTLPFFFFFNLKKKKKISFPIIWTFWPWQRILQQKDLKDVCYWHELRKSNTLKWTGYVKLIVLLPKSILKQFGRLIGTLNSTKPAMEIGILFKEPTRLSNKSGINGKYVKRKGKKKKCIIKIQQWFNDDRAANKYGKLETVTLNRKRLALVTNSLYNGAIKLVIFPSWYS